MYLLHLACEHTAVTEIEPYLRGEHYVLCPKCEKAKEEGVLIPTAWQKLHAIEETNGNMRELLSRFSFVMPNEIMRLRVKGSPVKSAIFPYRKLY